MPDENGVKLNYLLAPLVPLYGIGVAARNLLFNWGALPSVEYPVPVLSVGNLSVGGTCKTPHTEYLVNLLKKDYKVAVLSRGYKRKTRGFLIAGDASHAEAIGDEAYQMKLKFPDILIAVDGNRRRGIRNLLAHSAKPDVILLDDAYQHRYVTPSLSILLTDYNRLFYKDRLLPFGQLRESKGGIHRADAIIVTKCCEGLRPIDYRIIESEMQLLPHQQIFFTRTVYEPLRLVFPSVSSMAVDITVSDNEVLLLSGIASPAPFIREAERSFRKVTTLLFPDHHFFDKHDIARISEAFARLNSPDKFILTTGKDAVRLLHNPLVPQSWKDVLYYMPVRIGFCTESSLRFDDWVKNHIITFQRNNILH